MGGGHGRKNSVDGYLGSLRLRRAGAYKRGDNIFYKAQKFRENCGVQTTILIHNKDDLGTYHLYTTDDSELLEVLLRYVEIFK